MYLWTLEVEKVEWDKVFLKNGQVREYNQDAREMFLSDEPKEESKLDLEIEKKLVVGIFEIFKTQDISKSFKDPTVDDMTVDKNQVAITAEIVRFLEKYDFPLRKLDNAFADIKAFFSSIENLVRNNISSIDNEVVVKVMGLEQEGQTDWERIASIRLSHYIKALK